MNNLTLTRLLLFMMLASFAFGCKKAGVSEITHSPFHHRISAFTSGYIPTTGDVIIEFADSIKTATPGQEAASSIVSVTPKISGKWIWVNHRTLKFTPSKALPAGQKWQVALHMKRIFTDEKDDFFFGIATLPQNYRVSLDPIKPAELGDFENYSLSGKLMVANDINANEAKQMVQAKHDGKAVSITWQHVNNKTHLFQIAPLPRKKEKSKLVISHSGQPVNAPGNDEIVIDIPALGEFSVQNVEVIQQPRQVIKVAFSDPIDASQNIQGLIQISENVQFSYIVTDNLIEVFPSTNIYGDFSLVVLNGIRSSNGNMVDYDYHHNVTFASTNPTVEFIGNGNIMPFSDGLMMHFKAVSLKSVIVRVIKVYENNVTSFLQINALNESSQLKRAGRLVHQSVVSLEEDATLNLNDWNTFALDLSKMIQSEPGAIYRIELGFNKSNSVFPCVEDESDMTAEEINDGDFWDEPENYYSEYPYEYYYWNWDERDNPCYNAYYRRDRWATRNVLASDLGIIAKQGSAGNLQVFVTNLLSTSPMGDVTVDVLNYQMQSLGTAKTNAEGSAQINVSGKPFLLVAGKDNQRGYLRLDDARSISLSRFDVAGNTVRRGIKGFIYGERGVWRPGDSIFISFIAEDKNKSLPANHPVTFELVNPRGQLAQRIVSRHPQNLIYSFKTATPEEAPTGFWLARVTYGDVAFEQSLRIETIKPNRLRININAGEGILQKGAQNRIQLFSEWLHGAKASNLKADVTVNLVSTPTAFQNFKGFVFDDESITFEPREEVVFSGSLDADGKANFIFAPAVNQNAPGFLRATFATRVYEEGGSFSIDRANAVYSPYNRYVGILPPKGDDNGLLETGKNYKIEIATVNSKGEPLSANNLNYSVYKINWRWWWDRSSDDLARYVSSGSATHIATHNAKTANGKGVIDFRIDEPEWGRYLIQVRDRDGNHSSSIVVRVDWPGWAQRTGDDADGASMLMFSADKDKYDVGETATITFPSGDKGRALVSLENGSGIVNSWWVTPTKGSTKFSFVVTEQMTPNVFVHISLLQPHQNKDNDLPIRMYGITPITVNSPASHLSPVIKTTDEWRPHKKASIEVSEANGLAMSYTLAIVDDGLLDITRFRTPNAWEVFNAREALGVKTWDMYDFVLGAYGGRIERLFSIGGDNEIDAAQTNNLARRFEPMVKFLGPFDLNRKGKNKHDIDIPNYTGSVRVMVVATTGVANGAAQKSVPIRQPLMVWSGLPRVMGPQETVLLPVTVFASDKIKGDVTVTVKTDKLITSSGASEKTISFTQEGEKTIFFELKTGTEIGTSVIEVVAKLGNEQGSHVVNMPIRNANPPVTEVVSAILTAGQKTTLNYSLIGLKGTNSSVLEYSVIPPMDFGRRLEYLLGYPHGCIEQITSGGFPQIFLPELVKMDPAAVSKSKTNVQSVLNRLSQYQTASGGFAYWTGGSEPDEWATSYAGNFMLEAENKGFAVPSNVKRNWLTYQKAIAGSWMPSEHSSDFVQAYRLYTLALAGEANMAAMNRMKQQTNLSNSSRWRLAAAYAKAGMGEVAAQIILSLPDEAPDQNNYRYTYGSEERDMAMNLETLVLMGERERAARLVRSLSAKMNSSEWMSTQTTAYCLMAISSYATGSKISSNEVKVKHTVNNETPKATSFSKPLLREEINLEAKPKGAILVENNSDGEVFVNLILKGQPLVDDRKSAISETLVMRVEYMDLNNVPINIASLEQGTDFKVVVRMHNPGSSYVPNVALSQIFPSGWEIRNTRFEESGQSHERDIPDYRDIRDDRVYSYFDIPAGASRQFVTILHASFSGEFYLPAVAAEAMYDYSKRASVPGQWVKVERLK